MLSKYKQIYHSDKMLKNISIVIFFGSLWGITEATLGYLLHSMNLSIGWCLWFPLAFYFMDKIHIKTGKSSYMLYSAFIAAAIKLTNLFIEVRVDKVINPSVSIILEAITLTAAYKIMEMGHKRLNIGRIASINVVWRVIYSEYILLLPKSYLLISPLRASNPFLQFMLAESLVNSLIIWAYAVLRERLSIRQAEGKRISLSTKPVLSFALLSFAVALQWLI